MYRVEAFGKRPGPKWWGREKEKTGPDGVSGFRKVIADRSSTERNRGVESLGGK